MNVVQFHEYGGPSVLRYEEALTPRVHSNQILVKLHAIGVNFIDIYQRSGLYQVALPFIPGKEGAGTIQEVGTAVKQFGIGDRIVYALHHHSYAEFASVPAEKAVLLPDEISFEQAVAVFNQGLVAHYLCHDTFRGTGKHNALVHAAAGGVGGLLVQMLKQEDVTVFGTCSHQKKLKHLQDMHVDFPINYTKVDFAKTVLEKTEGLGVDVVFDSVGKDTFEKSLKCLKVRGCMVSFGQSSGAIKPVEIDQIKSKSLYLTRPMLPHFVQSYEELTSRAADLFRWLGEKKIVAPIDSHNALSDAWRSHKKIESRQTIGKCILHP